MMRKFRWIAPGPQPTKPLASSSPVHPQVLLDILHLAQAFGDEGLDAVEGAVGGPEFAGAGVPMPLSVALEDVVDGDRGE
jgi:hypothetical protein